MARVPTMMATISLALIVAGCSAGCTERRAQVAVQTALTAVAEGVSAADEIVAAEIPERARTATETARAEGGDVEVYIRIMQPWYDAATAIETTASTLRTGQSAVSAWVHGGDLGSEWVPFCNDIESGIEEIIQMLGILSVDVPSALHIAADYASELCSLAQPWYAGSVATDGGSDE